MLEAYIIIVAKKKRLNDSRRILPCRIVQLFMSKQYKCVSTLMSIKSVNVLIFDDIRYTTAH